MLVAVVVVVPLAACGSSAGGGSTSDGGPMQITVTESVRTIPYAPLYLAKENGYFAAHGLDVEIVPAQGGSAAVSAVVGGSAQVAAVSTIHAISATGEGRNIVSFAAIDQQLGVAVTVTKELWESSGLTEDSPLEDKIRLLQGRDLGIISSAGLNAATFNYLFAQHGIDPQGATQTALNTGTAMLGGLQNGLVDAINIAPPFPHEAIAQGYGHILINLTTGEDPTLRGVMADSFVTSREYRDSHAEVVESFTAAIGEAFEFLHENPQEAHDVLYDKYFNEVDAATFDLAFQDQLDGDFWPTSPEITEANVERLINFMEVAGTDEVPDNWRDAFGDLT